MALKVSPYDFDWLTWSNSLSSNFANKKNEYGKKYIQSAVLRERQQGEKRHCPHHGTGDNQRDCGAVLQRNRREERMGMVTKAHEAATPNTPSGTEQSEFFNGSLGLLNGSGSSYNAADAEANQEMAEILRRKKKRKRGFRL